MEEKNVKISGPVSLHILKDPKTERYFYFFGDFHGSLEGSCSQLQRGLKCDRPSFDYRGIITTDSNCWTISALLHEVFRYNGKQNITTDFYREISPGEKSNVNAHVATEILPRRSGLYKEPRSKEAVEKHKKRMKEINFDWIADIECTLWDKYYGSSVNLIAADARSFNNTNIVPMCDPYKTVNMLSFIPEAVRSFSENGDRREYTFKMREVLSDIDSVMVLSEQLAEEPYQLLKHFFETDDYLEASSMLINYIPTDSTFTKELVKGIYESIDKKYGFHAPRGKVLSLSSASLARLKRYNPEAHRNLMSFLKGHLEAASFQVKESSAEILSLLHELDLTDPDEAPNLLELVPHIGESLKLALVMTSSVMDAYILAETLQKETKQNFYYTGKEHTLNYVEFLTTYMGFEVLESIPATVKEDGPVRCVESSKIADLLHLYQARESLLI